ncbi:MAG: hypothetical protein ACE5GO_04845, partial [Anaerolineales bacterium]
RVAGTLLVVWAIISARASGVVFGFERIPPQVSLYLLLATGFRLGVAPMNVFFLTIAGDRREPPLRRGLGTMLRLTPAAASLVLLARTANVGVSASAMIPFLLALTVLAALYGGVNWVAAGDELRGRPFWVLGVAALAVAAAIRAQPFAAVAWGVVLLLGGGLLALFSARERWLLALFVVGGAGISTLPFSPSWPGSDLYSPFQPIVLLFLLAQGLLLAGFARHALRPGTSLEGWVRGIRAIYPVGLAIFPLTHFLIGWQLRLEGGGSPGGWWQGAASVGIAVLILTWALRGPRLPPRVTQVFRRGFSLHWLYRLLWRGYRVLGGGVSFLTVLLEGEGGMLWAFLLLSLLLSLIAQAGSGN